MSTNHTSAAEAQSPESIVSQVLAGGPEGALGRLATIKMLDEIHTADVEEVDLLGASERGTPQRDIVGEHLAQLPPEQIAGFTSMLTHALSGYVHGCPPTLEWLEVLALNPTKEAEQAWDLIQEERQSA